MKTNTTRDLSVRLVSQLRAGDQVAAFQFGGKVELIQTWTSDQSVAIHSLQTKLSSGRHGRFQHALAAASVQLTIAPPGNRHIVLVTDGGESLLDKDDLAAGMKQLYTAQATVHLISYTSLGRKAGPGAATWVTGALSETERAKSSQAKRPASVIAFGNPVTGRDEQRNEALCTLPEAATEVTSIAKTLTFIELR
ncbi:MAG TPA: VWA domain-containing protein [Pyrinomonadaceae bacterium]